MAESTSPPSPRGPIAWVPLALVALGVVAIHAICLTQYGWFRDELYYLSCSKRLAWGYVDLPPLSAAVLALLRAVAGESLATLRLAAAIVAATVALLSALIARELGGRRFAQTVAAASVGVCPMLLGIGHFYSMNVLDFAFWALGTLCALRAIDRGTWRDWIGLGIVLGLGLLNKWSVLWLGAGLFAGLALSPQRRLLATPGPWLAAAVAVALLALNLMWQVRHDWATLEFMHDARTQKMVALEPLRFLLDNVLVLGPGAAPIWLAGLVAALAPGRARWRLLAVVYGVTLAILLASGSARAEYITLPCPALFAAGATWWESRRRLARNAIAAIALVLAVPIAPLAIPILPVQAFIAYQAALGRKPATEERHRMGALPQQYADMIGWPELADSVARVTATLPEAERRRAIVVVDNYGDAGALERFGAGRVPTIACQHNNWYLWGPPAWDGGTAIIVGRDSSEVAGEFDQVIVAGTAGHPLAMSYEQGLPIIIARRFHGDLAKAWKHGKKYV